MARRFWTQARIAELKRLWSAGRTAGAIGATLGGITRSAVLGKVFRLRLVAQNRKRSAPTLDETPARRRAAKAPPPKPAAAKRRKTLFDLTNECCRWPYGELGGKRFFFCGEAGADVARGIPYRPRLYRAAELGEAAAQNAGARAFEIIERQRRELPRIPAPAGIR